MFHADQIWYWLARWINFSSHRIILSVYPDGSNELFLLCSKIEIILSHRVQNIFSPGWKKYRCGREIDAPGSRTMACLFKLLYKLLKMHLSPSRLSLPTCPTFRPTHRPSSILEASVAQWKKRWLDRQDLVGGNLSIAKQPFFFILPYCYTVEEDKNIHPPTNHPLCIEWHHTQQEHDVETTSYWCGRDVMTSHPRQYDVILTSCAHIIWNH